MNFAKNILLSDKANKPKWWRQSRWNLS